MGKYTTVSVESVAKPQNVIGGSGRLGDRPSGLGARLRERLRGLDAIRAAREAGLLGEAAADIFSGWVVQAPEMDTPESPLGTALGRGDSWDPFDIVGLIASAEQSTTSRHPEPQTGLDFWREPDSRTGLDTWRSPARATSIRSAIRGRDLVSDNPTPGMLPPKPDVVQPPPPISDGDIARLREEFDERARERERARQRERNPDPDGVVPGAAEFIARYLIGAGNALGWRPAGSSSPDPGGRPTSDALEAAPGLYIIPGLADEPERWRRRRDMPPSTAITNGPDPGGRPDKW